MRIFLSWSGEQSRDVALALRDWLPSVIQSVEPWVSTEDIRPGSKWISELTGALESSSVGIVCLTPENLNSPWMLFEVGALSKNVDTSLVCLYMFGLDATQISGPLSQFQAVRSDQEDTFRLLRSLNEKSEKPLEDSRLLHAFETWWPHLEHSFASISPAPREVERDRAENLEEKVDRILDLLESEKNATSHELPPDSSVRETRRPRVFIGSSTEGLDVAEAIQVGLDPVAECRIWTQGTFDIGSTVIDSVVEATAEFEFAILVLTADDMTERRGQAKAAPRDNIIFELGLFTGALTRARTFMVINRDDEIHLPSDLAGVTAATYSSPSDGNLIGALGPVCTRIKRAMGV